MAACPTPRNPVRRGTTAILEAARPGCGWQFLVLAAIGNFAVLRRQAGGPEAAAMVADVAGRLQALVPGASAKVSGRDLIEVVFTGRARSSLEEALLAIEAAFDRPLQLCCGVQTVELTLGAAAMPVRDLDEVRLAEEAEQALVDARLDRRTTTRLVPAATTVDRITLARDLHLAVRHDELFLQYQPKLHVRSRSIGSVEALIRWNHPLRGAIQPNDFIPLAEQSRDIVALTLWTIRRAVADQREMRLLGHDLTIFINIAGVLLADARFVRQACLLVQASDARLGFEITETSVIRDPAGAIANLKAFAEIGVTISIDDYGAGLSSLAYLKQLPARELKIDKLFVTQLTSSHRDPLIVRSTIDLAHAMEMEVVAEGVETPASLALLSVMGCDMAQGFLISRPLSFDVLIDYLDEERHLQTPDPRQVMDRLAAQWRTG